MPATDREAPDRSLLSAVARRKSVASSSPVAALSRCGIVAFPVQPPLPGGVSFPVAAIDADCRCCQAAVRFLPYQAGKRCDVSRECHNATILHCDNREGGPGARKPVTRRFKRSQPQNIEQGNVQAPRGSGSPHGVSARTAAADILRRASRTPAAGTVTSRTLGRLGDQRFHRLFAARFARNRVTAIRAAAS